MKDTVLARLAALKTSRTIDLKQQWRDLFESEPPPYNRRFLEHRLAYRIQELAYGGLKPGTPAPTWPKPPVSRPPRQRTAGLARATSWSFREVRKRERRLGRCTAHRAVRGISRQKTER